MRIVDRIKELIKYNGYQVAPAELEGVLLTHPAIADAAVTGTPDEQAGEIPKAFVVPNAPLASEEVTAFVAERVAPYKKIRVVELVEEIPKSPSGKILRRVLIDREHESSASGVGCACQHQSGAARLHLPGAAGKRDKLKQSLQSDVEQ